MSGDSPNSSRGLGFWPVPALFAVLVVLCLRLIQDWDVWFHLVIGREVAQSGSIPSTQFYLFPYLDQPGEFHEWGFGLLCYGFEVLGGGFGLSLLSALLGAGALLLVHRAARGAGAEAGLQSLPLVAWLAPLALSLAVLDFRLLLRPEQVFYLAVAATILCMERWLALGGAGDSPTRDWRWLAGVPVVALLLAQCHPSPLVLMPVVGAYGLQAAWTDRHWRPLLWAGGAALAALLLACVNPYGVQQVLLPLSFGGGLAQDLAEFLPVWKTGQVPAFLVLALAALGAMALGPRRPVDALLVLAFGVLALLQVRNLAVWALVCHVPIARAFAAQMLEWGLGAGQEAVHLRDGTVAMRAVSDEALRGKRGPGRHVAWSVGLTLLSLAVVLLPPRLQGRLGTGLDSEAFPDQALGAVLELEPPGRLVNFFHLGGYQAWRIGDRYPPYIDGHNWERSQAIERHHALFRADPGWQKTLRNLQAEAVLTPATLSGTGELIPLVEALANDLEWALVTREASAMLFVRRNRVKTRVPLSQSQIWEQVWWEADELLKRNPRASMALETRNYANEKLIALQPGNPGG